MKKNDRQQALRALAVLHDEQIPLSQTIQAQAEISPLTKELCYGVCRHYIRLEAIADILVPKKPKDTQVWICLLMGLYELHYLRTPDYAVVQETVALLDKNKKSWAKGLVNAVLRRFCREQEAIITQVSANIAVQQAHPQWFVDRVHSDWPEAWETILAANNERAPMSLRVNRLQQSREEYLKLLTAQGISAEELKHSIDGIALSTPCDVYDLPGFKTGAVSVQDEAAQFAVHLLDVQDNQRILDLCCAPGGKTGHILEQGKSITCIAVDIDEKRLSRVRDNLKRLNLQAELIADDALNVKRWWDGQLFDRILLDAPCSALGVIRRHPDIKLLRRAADVAQIASLQCELLKTSWSLLKPGGKLLYVTCSVLKEENDQQIAHFLKLNADAINITPQQTAGRMTPYGWQLLPGDFNQDGFFYSLLQKQA